MPISIESLERTVRASFGDALRVRARRPGRLYQIEIPAYLPDGDSALVFVAPRDDGRLLVSDLGHVRMRLSYTRKLTEQTDETLRALARRHGFDLEEGEVRTILPPEELAAGAVAMAQVQSAAAEALASAAFRGLSGERFKRIVREALQEVFAAVCEVNYQDTSDGEGIYCLDVLLKTPTWLGVAIIPSDLDAERAVISRLRVGHEFEKRGQRARWVAIPKDVNELRDVTRRHLMDNYLLPTPAWSLMGMPALREKLSDLGDMRQQLQ